MFETFLRKIWVEQEINDVTNELVFFGEYLTNKPCDIHALCDDHHQSSEKIEDLKLATVKKYGSSEICRTSSTSR